MSAELPVLIVGQGLSGSILAHTFDSRGKDFRVIDNAYASASSLAAAGLVNSFLQREIFSGE